MCVFSLAGELNCDLNSPAPSFQFFDLILTFLNLTLPYWLLSIPELKQIIKIKNNRNTGKDQIVICPPLHERTPSNLPAGHSIFLTAPGDRKRGHPERQAATAAARKTGAAREGARSCGPQQIAGARRARGVCGGTRNLSLFAQEHPWSPRPQRWSLDTRAVRQLCQLAPSICNSRRPEVSSPSRY